MSNYIDLPGAPQNFEEWTETDFALQNLFSPPSNTCQDNFNSPFSNSVLPQQQIHQQNFRPSAGYFPSHDATLQTSGDSVEDLNLSPQASFTGVVMSNPNSILDNPAEPSQSTGTVTKLKCKSPGCPEDREFLTDLALRKHQDKHKKPYSCAIPGCKHPQFGDKGGLDRHKREVHGSTKHCCPIVSCKRHIRGFPRKYNLFEHQKRYHPGQLPGSPLEIHEVPRYQTRVKGETTAEVIELDQEVFSPETTLMDDAAGGSVGKLHEKLRGLYALRTELDRDIDALKRAVDILEDSCP